jgi:hypothetical protein
MSGLETLETTAPPATRRCCRLDGETVEEVATEVARQLFAEGVVA